MKKIVFSLGGILFALLVAAAGWVVLNSEDAPTVEDSDLLVAEQPEIPAEENAFTHLQRAMALLQWPEEETAQQLMTPSMGDQWDVILAKSIIAQNSQVFTEMSLALEAPFFQVPPAPVSPDDIAEQLAHPGLGWQTRLVKLLRLRALVRMANGDQAAAFDDLVQIVYLGQRVQQAQGGALIYFMIGYGIKGVGLESMKELSDLAVVSPGESRRISSALGNVKTDTEAWTRMAAVEYQSFKEFQGRVDVREATDTGLLGQYMYHPNRTKNDFAEMWRTFGKIGAMPCAQTVVPASLLYLKGDRWWLPKFWAIYLELNSVGKILVAVATPNFHRFQFKRCQADARISMVQALLALKAYKDEHGRLPQTLEELRPDFLIEMPLDAFDGQPLRYIPEKRLLYSVGRDPLKPDEYDPFQLTWEIPFS